MALRLLRSVPSLAGRAVLPARASMLQPAGVGATRLLAKKSKAAGKGSKAVKGKRESAEDGEESDVEVDFDALKEKMQKTFEHFQRELASMQAGRATPTMLDGVKVSVHGTQMPLSAVAKVLVQGTNALQISVYDGTHTDAICKAIEKEEMNLSPEAVGKTIRVPIPRLTADMREVMVKQVKKSGESCRIHIRGHRQTAMKQAKAMRVKDVVQRQEKQVQKLHDDMVAKVDAAVKAKVSEVGSL